MNHAVRQPSISFLNAAVLVSALGYFVDIFDLLMFSIVRVKSLQDIGLSGEALTQAGLHVINMQMIGMLLGGIAWGVLGDKRGRLKVLFGSILLYSIANIANAYVRDANSYAICRLIAGIGLAGEIGAGITLVCESLPKDKRGIGTTIVATIGVSGACFAALVAEMFSWRTAYMIGGAMGLLLLVLRASVLESSLFEKVEAQAIKRGSFLCFFKNATRLKNYLLCILMGVPVWYFVGILGTLSPELAKNTGLADPINLGLVITFSYAGITVGDFVVGMLSQFLHSRRKAAFAMLSCFAVLCLFFFTQMPLSLPVLYAWYFIAGVSGGIWVLVVTCAAELFGTNLRATAASTIPNFVRGSLVLLNTSVATLQSAGVNIVTAAAMIGAVVIVLALAAVYFLPETFSRDLDFHEAI